MKRHDAFFFAVVDIGRFGAGSLAAQSSRQAGTGGQGNLSTARHWKAGRSPVLGARERVVVRDGTIVMECVNQYDRYRIWLCNPLC